MTLCPLAPRPKDLVLPVLTGPRLSLLHFEDEWEAKFSEIERLYVQERRKLRYIVQYMEREYGFKATEQMYKKRFAKWGLQKSSRSSRSALQRLKTGSGCKDPRFPQKRASLSMSSFPTFTPHDRLKLVFLTSVRTWTLSFFQSIQWNKSFLASNKNQRHPTDQPRVGLMFKLAIDLLDRGLGKLAGRMARKAFLLLEELLTLDAPALLWNVIDMMHDLLALGHGHLFQTLLTHLLALASGKMPDAHPLYAMLRSLQGLIASLSCFIVSHDKYSSSKSSSSLSSASGSDRNANPVNLWLSDGTIPSLFAQAWTDNAKLIFERFDPGLIELYSQLVWDSCSIKLPETVAGAAVHLLSQIEARRKVNTAAEDSIIEQRRLKHQLKEEDVFQRLYAPRWDASPPEDYEMLYTSSIAALQEEGRLILSNKAGLRGSTNTFIGIIASLLTAEILDDWPANIKGLIGATIVPRMHAGNIACAIKTLIDLRIQAVDDGMKKSSYDVKRIRSLVALREYAHGATDPLVIRELLLLKDQLGAAGEPGAAQKVEQDVCRRLEIYLREIPTASI